MADKTEVTIDIIIHATEDVDKFYKAFEKMFGVKQKAFSVQNLTGHYDNPITVLSGKFTKKDAGGFIEKLVQSIPSGELNGVIDELDELISSSGLHLRFDKQEFVRGRLAMREKNAVKVRIYTPVYNKKETADAYLTLLDGSN